MSLSKITGLALLLSLAGAANGNAEEANPNKANFGKKISGLSKEEKLKYCKDEMDKRGIVYGTNPQCDAKFKKDDNYTLCLKAEDAQGLQDLGLTVTTHPWTEYSSKPEEACPRTEVCAEVTASAKETVETKTYVCADGTTQVNDIKDCPPTTMNPEYQCQDGSWRTHKAACPSVEGLEQEKPILTYVCPDNTPDIPEDNILVDDSSKCPEVKPASTEPVIKYRCEDGTVVDVSYECPHPHASTILVRVETAQGYSEANGRTGTLAGAVDVEVGAGIYLGGFAEARMFSEAHSSKKRSEDSQYIATESGDHLIGSQADLETITQKNMRYTIGLEMLYNLYAGIADNSGSVNAQARVGLTRQNIGQRILETTRYWAQTQAGTVIQEGIPGPTGPAETDSSSETRYGVVPSAGLNAWLPAMGPLAVGVGVNGSYHHVFGQEYSIQNWGVDGSINLNFFFGGETKHDRK